MRYLYAALIVSVLPWLSLNGSPFYERHPNNWRGETSSMHEFPDAPDRIDLFNGNLSIRLPLGIQYPVTEDLKYQFALHYSSAVWDRQPVGDAVRLTPSQLFNAGLGWYVGFGEVLAPNTKKNPTGTWIFVDPDGASHVFYSTIRPGAAESDPEDRIRYTRDGSALRLRIVDSTSVVVDGEGGLSRHYAITGGEWRLTAVRNAYGAGITVSWPSSTVQEFSDGYRVQRMVYTSDLTGTYDRLVSHMELSSYGGTPAVYAFTYSSTAVTVPSFDTDETTPATVQVPVLTAVSQPNETNYRMWYVGATDTNRSRLLARLDLPTGGRIHWSYAPWTFALPGCSGLAAIPQGGLGPLQDWNVGVVSRTARNADGVKVTGAWSWSTNVRGAVVAQPACTDLLTRETAVTTPRGDKHVHYFNVTTNSTLWQSRRYAFPLSYEKAEYVVGTAAATQQVYPSRRDFDCEPNGTCTPVREHWQSVLQDSHYQSNAYQHYDSHRRVVGERTRYLDDVVDGAAVVADVLRDRWDGLGTFRRTETGGTFAAANVKIDEYDPGSGTAVLDVPAPGEAWILSKPLLSVRMLGGSRRIRAFCWAAGTGALTRERIYETQDWPAAPSANDVVLEYERDAAGNVVRVRQYGGDRQSVSVSPLCGAVLSAPEIVNGNEYEHGALARRYRLSGTTRLLPYELDLSIDAHTGRIAERRERGIATTYQYDAMGRLTWLRASVGPWIENRYHNATGSGDLAARHEVLRRKNGVTTDAGILQHTIDTADPFGRTWRESRRMPDGSWSSRTFEYDAQGALTSRTEWQTASTAAGTTLMENYDPFNRVRTIVPAEGTAHAVTYTYRGVRQVTDVWKSWAGWMLGMPVKETPRSRTTTYDRQGATQSVYYHPAHWSESGQLVETVHDVDGENVEMSVDGEIRQSVVRDGRGFVRQLVDSGITTSFSSHDTEGNAWRVKKRGFDLAQEHDQHGRLTSVRQVDNNFVWKTFEYGSTGAAAGQVTLAVRHHALPAGATSAAYTASVTTAYSYDSVHGNVSSVLTTVAARYGTFSFRERYLYDDGGGIARITHPSCEVCPRNVPMRTLTVDYTNRDGFLTEIRPSLNGASQGVFRIAYHDSGLIREMKFPNGLVETWEEDPSGRPRIGGVTVAGAYNGTRSLADFQYDGAGLLVRAGDQYLVPTSLYTETVSPETGTSACGDDSQAVDPFGDILADKSIDLCTFARFYLYDAMGRIVQMEDRDKITWLFSAADGRPLTKYVTYARTGHFMSINDEIYGGDLRLSNVGSTEQAPQTKWLYYHSSHRGCNGFSDDNRAIHWGPDYD